MSMLLVEGHGAVRVLTLNRPEKKNALNEALAVELVAALASADEEDSVHVVVVTGSGDAFCAGVDVHVFLDLGKTGLAPPVLSKLDEPLRAFSKPLIAGVQGLAVGMGLTLLPHFDLVYASRSARFHLPFAQLGLVVEYGSSCTLPRLIGRQRANELVLRGKPISAETASDWGLVTRVFDDGSFQEQLMQAAADVASLPTGAIRASKKLLRQGEESSVDEALEREHEVLSRLYGLDENVKAVEAFLTRAAASRS
jgi:enoyl-CoA hydratase/carnithine racemase